MSLLGHTRRCQALIRNQTWNTTNQTSCCPSPCSPELLSQIKAEVDKLIAAGFIREVKYSTWIENIVLVKKKITGQIRICGDFRDLNKACSKDDFPLPIIELMVDATTGHEALSFKDGSLDTIK
ncbi:unnamed protein product [Prunus armeniaca]